MDNSELVCGRPYGGCSILYRKSLASCITPLDSCSNRFCGVKFNCSSGLSMIKKPRGARRKRSRALDSCFGLVSPHQQSILFPYLKAPRVIKVHSGAALVVLN